MADAAVLGWHEITEGQTPGVEEYWIQSCLLVRKGRLQRLLKIPYYEVAVANRPTAKSSPSGDVLN